MVVTAGAVLAAKEVESHAASFATGAAELGAWIKSKLEDLSEKEKQDLKMLKSDFTTVLYAGDPKLLPAWIGIDDKDGSCCPTGYDDALIDKLQSRTSFFTSIASEIEKACGKYLQHRISHRRLGKYKCDATHQIFYDLRFFACDNLSLFRPENEFIEKIDLRIKFIKEKCASYHFLDIGRFPDEDFNTRTVLDRIQKLLEIAKSRAVDERNKESVRQKVDRLCNATSSLKSYAIHSLYNLIKPTFINGMGSDKLLPPLYIDLVATGERKARGLGQSIFGQAIISFCQDKEVLPVEKDDFNRSYSRYFSKYIVAYLQSDKKGSLKKQFLSALNTIYKELSSLRKMIDMLELAKSVVSAKGDQWCYGDDNGQSLILGLSELVKKANENLLTAFSVLNGILTLTRSYTTGLAKGPDAKSASGRTFRALEKSVEHTKGILLYRKSAVEAIKIGVKEWPPGADKQVKDNIYSLGCMINDLMPEYGLKALTLFSVRDEFIATNLYKVSIDEDQVIAYKKSWANQLLDGKGAKLLNRRVSPPTEAIVYNVLNDSVEKANQVYPSSLSAYIRSEDSYFIGRKLRYKFFIGQERLFEALSRAYVLAVSLYENPVKNFDDMLKIHPGAMSEARNICDEQLARIQASYKQLHWYNFKAKRFLRSWRQKIVDRRLMMQHILDQTIEKSMALVEGLKKKTFQFEDLSRYSQTASLLTDLLKYALSEDEAVRIKLLAQIKSFKTWVAGVLVNQIKADIYQVVREGFDLSQSSRYASLSSRIKNLLNQVSALYGPRLDIGFLVLQSFDAWVRSAGRADITACLIQLSEKASASQRTTTASMVENSLSIGAGKEVDRCVEKGLVDQGEVKLSQNPAEQAALLLAEVRSMRQEAQVLRRSMSLSLSS